MGLIEYSVIFNKLQVVHGNRVIFIINISTRKIKSYAARLPLYFNSPLQEPNNFFLALPVFALTYIRIL